jgi:hypothetical protein
MYFMLLELRERRALALINEKCFKIHPMYEILCLRAVQNPQVILFFVFHFNYEFLWDSEMFAEWKKQNMTFLSVDILRTFFVSTHL